MIRTVVVACVAVLFATYAMAADGLKTQFIAKGSNGAEKTTLLFYDASCDGPAECEVADFGCADRGDFSGSIGGLDQKQMAAWFASSAGTIRLTFDATTFDIQASKIEFGEMNAEWEATFTYDKSGADIWKALAKSKKLSLTVGKKTLSLPRTKDFGALMKACAP